jgi:hypothetical protein
VTTGNVGDQFGDQFVVDIHAQSSFVSISNGRLALGGIHQHLFQDAFMDHGRNQGIETDKNAMQDKVVIIPLGFMGRNGN